MNIHDAMRTRTGWLAAVLLAVLLAAPAGAAEKNKKAPAQAAAKDKNVPAAPAGDTAGFAALDINSDGFLSIDEFLKMQPGTNGAPAVSSIPLTEQPKMRREFAGMDKDRDQKVSELEYSEATAPKIKHEPPKQEHKKGNIRKLANKARRLLPKTAK